jgi:magnesium chelatase family protein
MMAILGSELHGCPCGYYIDATRSCTCSVTKIRRYLQRISGPLLDRVDSHIEVPRLQRDEMLTPADGEPSRAVRARVGAARQRQTQRSAGSGIFCDAHMQARDIKRFCALSDEVKTFLSKAIDQLGLSARAFDRVVKLSRTIADLDGAESIALPHVAEAIQYRGLDRKLWA